MPTKEIPKAFIGSNNSLPYSPVVKIGNHYHFSGVLPDLDGKNRPIAAKLVVQALQIIRRMEDLLKKCDLTLDDVYSVTIMMEENMKFFPQVNDVYAKAFSNVEIKPRRKAFAVAALPFGAKIEIEFDAVCQK